MPASRAMWLEAPGTPLRPGTVAVPDPGPDEVLVRVQACAVCRTDLHIVDGELPLVLARESAGHARSLRAAERGFAPFGYEPASPSRVGGPVSASPGTTR